MDMKGAGHLRLGHGPIWSWYKVKIRWDQVIHGWEGSLWFNDGIIVKWWQTHHTTTTTTTTPNICCCLLLWPQQALDMVGSGHLRHFWVDSHYNLNYLVVCQHIFWGRERFLEWIHNCNNYVGSIYVTLQDLALYQQVYSVWEVCESTPKHVGVH